MPRTLAVRFVGPLVAVGLLSLAARGEDFRIESKVFVGKDKNPVSQNTTLFRAGVVYDYLAEPQRIAVFDGQRGRFVLLDPARRLKTEVKTDEVRTFTEGLQALLAKKPNADKKFLAHPTFETHFDDKTKVLSLTSPVLTYKIETVPAKSAEAAKQYREFSDWYARFNAYLNPGSQPPFSRLVVNEELSSRELLATQVQLSFQSAGHGLSLRSEHRVSWRLLERDLDQITEAANQLTAFKTVRLEEFRQATDPARAAATSSEGKSK